MNDYLDNIFEDIKLDENQKKAILDENKYQMIIAGAGSGKTTTMAAKVKYLVDIKKINPQNILLISFTNKAVQELKDKIENEFGINANICTFHKLALSILKDAGVSYKIISDNSLIFKQFLIDYINLNGKNKLYKIVNNYVNRKALKEEKLDVEKFLKLKLVIDQFNYFYCGQNLKINKKQQRFILFAKQYKQYLEKYMDTNKLIDFDTMIFKATEQIDNCTLKYQYVIVDEYQDISKERYELLKKMVLKMESNLTVVGDDWQAIFAFAGSRVDLFMHFQDDMGASCNKIVNTYRNSQELINIAGNFIMKDEKQIKKELKSNKHLDNPIKLIKYTNDWDKADILFNLVKYIITNNKKQTILLLGRYKFDIEFLKHSELFNIIDDDKIYIEKLNITLPYLTVHSAKGLGFDQVIILNMTNGEFGFPSNKQDDKIIKLIKQNDVTEERRLFYVALTRTKNYVYLLVPRNKVSPFINEIRKMNGVSEILKKDFKVN